MKKLMVCIWIIGMMGSAACAEGELKNRPLSDRQMGHQIHTAIVGDPTLPYCAHIVDVHAEKGKVTLKGLVHSEEEKATVGEKAAAIAGDNNVTNEVRIKEPLDVASR